MNFDEFIDLVKSVHTVNIHPVSWELSECSCSIWQNMFKCYHVIATAARLKLTTFDKVVLSLPLNKKNKRDPKPKRKTALERESIDNRPIAPVINEIESEEEAEDEVQEEEREVPVKKRRGRPPSKPAAKKFKFNDCLFFIVN